MSAGAEEFKEIKRALVGDKFGEVGGIVKKLQEIEEALKNKASKEDIENMQKSRRWLPRDKALIYGAFITGVAGVIAAVITSLLH